MAIMLIRDVLHSTGITATEGKLSGLTAELSSISVFNSLAAGGIWVPVFSAFP